MLGDLRTQLAKVGRLDVLEAVGDKAMAYFASRDPGDLDDTTLARHAKALTQVGEIRMDQARYAEAGAAFAEAYRRAAALAARHPQDGNMLFERGQAEFWIGFVHWKRGQFSEATEWLTRYHDTGLALVALDPTRPAWRGEVAYGQQTLAVLRQERGEFAAARTDFLALLATLEKMLEQNPGDLELRFRIANAHSWLGGLAEQQGEFAEALDQYVTQTKLLEQLAAAEPRTARWRFLLADAFVLQSNVHLATGHLADAGKRLREARRLIDELTAFDPSNRHWSAASLHFRLQEALFARKQGDLATAARLVGEVQPQLESLSAAEPTDRKFILWLLTAWRLEGQLRVSAGRSDAASAAARAVELGEKLIRESRATNVDVGECALAGVMAGEISAQAGDASAARRHWQHAADLLAPRLSGTHDWRLLDPAARAAAWLGRSEEARAMISQLNSLGYVPLDPWPATDRPGASHSPDHQPEAK
jgi:serine/threonine-protein kinase